jgi:mRNA interferase HicA
MYIGKCILLVKKTELERRLRGWGWWLDRQGRRHEVWTNGEMTEAVPRHKEIDEGTARSIIRKAQASHVKGVKP